MHRNIFQQTAENSLNAPQVSTEGPESSMESRPKLRRMTAV